MAKIDYWEPEDDKFWESKGKRIASRNLWISIPNLLLGFAIWLFWSIVIKQMQDLNDADPNWFPLFDSSGEALKGKFYRAKLYTLPAVAGLAGASLRIPNSFLIAVSGGRNVISLTSFLLLLPTLGTGIALQDPQVSFTTLVILAVLSGVGGGAFASSMSNISFFYPKRVQGTSLGLNAGLGNLGVSVMQLLLPFAMSVAIFGPLSGEGLAKKGASSSIWIQNAGLIWVPVLAVFMIAAWVGMNNLPQHKTGGTAKALGKAMWLEMLGFIGAGAGVVLLLMDWGPVPELLKIFVVLLVAVAVTMALMRYATGGETKESLLVQFKIFRNKHNWVMTWLYVMTFGSFIGFSAAFPKLIMDVFGYIRVDANGTAYAEAIKNPNAPNAFHYAWLGPLVGSLIRPIGGWLSDKLGGARVTQWDTVVMIGATIGVAYFVQAARMSPTPEEHFLPFLLLFLLLFITTGIGNGSTFRMVPMIFERAQAGPVLGFISAIAAYGAFLIPKIFATQIKSGTPEYALYGFAVYYTTCLGVNWWFYARKNAEIKC